MTVIAVNMVLPMMVVELLRDGLETCGRTQSFLWLVQTVFCACLVSIIAFLVALWAFGLGYVVALVLASIAFYLTAKVCPNSRLHLGM